ncbi:hypothetical protein EVAR_34469_1 [Eumeta japonica]|uniref:Uncharacterized protein n=1 Tax=Eumeta variegata TaxID=151549 RepID=A0A4C1WY91_EUMVA|nr:hypothetical protein EVAR_34469_1 [Eumeta japonica]
MSFSKNSAFKLPFHSIARWRYKKKSHGFIVSPPTRRARPTAVSEREYIGTVTEYKRSASRQRRASARAARRAGRLAYPPSHYTAAVCTHAARARVVRPPDRVVYSPIHNRAHGGRPGTSCIVYG